MKPEDIEVDLSQPVWLPGKDHNGLLLEIGAPFWLDLTKSEVEVAEVKFQRQTCARMTIITKPVLSKDGDKYARYDHGWKYHWHVHFMGSHWKEMKFRGDAKTIEMARRMCYNVVLGLHDAIGHPSKPFKDSEVIAMKYELTNWRRAAGMVRYVLKEKFSDAWKEAEHWLRMRWMTMKTSKKVDKRRTR